MELLVSSLAEMRGSHRTAKGLEDLRAQPGFPAPGASRAGLGPPRGSTRTGCLAGAAARGASARREVQAPGRPVGPPGRSPVCPRAPGTELLARPEGTMGRDPAQPQGTEVLPPRRRAAGQRRFRGLWDSRRVTSACFLRRPSPGAGGTPSCERTCIHSPEGGRGHRGHRVVARTCDSEPADLFPGGGWRERGAQGKASWGAASGRSGGKRAPSRGWAPPDLGLGTGGSTGCPVSWQ